MTTQAREQTVRTIAAAARRHVAAATRHDHETAASRGLALSTCEANFVNLLLVHGPLTPGQLGELTGLRSSGTITGAIDRLERAGYIHRTRCVADRRKVFVELDHDRIDAGNATRDERLAVILKTYSADEVALIADFLDRLARTEADATADVPTD